MDHLYIVQLSGSLGSLWTAETAVITLQSNAIALFCVLGEDIQRTGCANGQRPKNFLLHNAVNNIATTESSVPTKAMHIITHIVVDCQGTDQTVWMSHIQT